MNARQKLNAFFVYGCLLVSSVIGLATNSLPMFLAALVVSLLGSLHNGDIRPDRRRR